MNRISIDSKIEADLGKFAFICKELILYSKTSNYEDDQCQYIYQSVSIAKFE